MTIKPLSNTMLDQISGGVHLEIGRPVPIHPDPGLPKPPILVKPPRSRLPDVPPPDFIPGPSLP